MSISEKSPTGRKHSGSFTNTVTKLLSLGDAIGLEVCQYGSYSSSHFAKTKVQCLAVTKLMLDNVAGSAAAALKRCETRKAKRALNLNPGNLKLEAILGVGSFGHVQLGLYTLDGVGTRKVCAVKCMSKEVIEATEQEMHVENEKWVLSNCNYHLIPMLHAAWQTPTHYCLVLDIVQGGELFSLLQNQGPLQVNDARFYIACAAAALTYLHSLGVVYRDLKPENILIDAEGYATLVDMGFAKVVVGRTYTLCGTPDYMAPEVIDGTGHALPCDWWSLGILAYECLIGKPPFADDDVLVTFRQAQKADYNLPWLFPRDAGQFISSLLVIDAVSRHGGAGQSLFDTQFLKSMPLQSLDERALKAPHVPAITSLTDVTAFDELTVDDVQNYGGDEGILIGIQSW